MVTGRAHHAEGRAPLSPLEALDGVDPRAGGQQGRVPGLGAGAGVGIDVPAAGHAEGLELPQMGERVHAFEVGEGGRPRLRPHEVVADPGRLQAGDHGV